MFPKTLTGVVLACGALTVAVPPHDGCPGGRFLAGFRSSAAAGDKKDAAVLTGAWVKKDQELKIEFDKKVIKIAPHGDYAMVGIMCDYTIEKAGRVKAKVTAHEGSAEVKEKIEKHVPIGLKFSFQWKVNGATATLADLRGDDVDTLKSRLEGDFEKKE